MAGGRLAGHANATELRDIAEPAEERDCRQQHGHRDRCGPHPDRRTASSPVRSFRPISRAWRPPARPSHCPTSPPGWIRSSPTSPRQLPDKRLEDANRMPATGCHTMSSVRSSAAFAGRLALVVLQISNPGSSTSPYSVFRRSSRKSSSNCMYRFGVSVPAWVTMYSDS